jgi:hypothetical protein
MTKNKTAVPATDTTAKTQNLPVDFTIDASKSAEPLLHDLALQTMRASIGWRGGYTLPIWSSRNLQRLQRKQKRLGRKPSELIIAGFDGGAK